MKLQLQGQTVRVRLGEREATELLAGGEVKDATATALGSWSRELALGDGAALSRTAAGAWRLVLPALEFRAFAAARPRRDGMDVKVPGPEGSELSVVIEIDVREGRRLRVAADTAS